MKVKTLKQMLEAVPDNYDLAVQEAGDPHDKPEIMACGIGVHHRKFGSEGAVKFRFRSPAKIGKAAPSCQWAADDEGIWETGCGELFQFDADGPAENGFKFCPYCGKGLCEVSDG